MDRTINVSIKYNGLLSPFSIQPRCPFYKFMTAIQNGLSIKITKITHQNFETNEFINISFDVSQNNKYLLEDLHFKAKDIIEIEGTPIKSFIPLENEISVNIIHPFKSITIEIKIGLNTCSTSAIYSIVSNNIQSYNIGNFKLFYNSDEMINNDDLIAKYGLVNKSNIYIV